jgi:BNR repeat-like domain
MRRFSNAIHLFVLIMALTFLSVGAVNAKDGLTRVSRKSPFSDCSILPVPGEANYLNAEVEPWIAVNPTNRDHLIGVWQQDRWQLGGSRGLLTGVSRDGGQTWTRTFAHFSRCAGGNAANGGDFERASDPWVTFSPNGTAYQIALTFDAFDANQAVLVSHSSDGGDTWSEPTALIFDTDPNIGDDKESITADPRNSRFVYAVWDRLDFTGFPIITGPVWFARTTNGGASWESARIIFDPGPNASTLSNQIIVLPDGTLVDLFDLFNSNGAFLAVIRSSDKGITWSQPIIVNTQESIGIVDIKTGEPVRAGLIPNIAVNQKNGTLYVVWEDARFSGSLRDGVVFSKSTDGGLTWSPPVQVNQAPNVQAFTPSIAIARNGRLAITYYDFRKDTPDPVTLLTNYWRITSDDGGNTWHEIPLGGSFDMRNAPVAIGGFFVGDYEGLGYAEGSFTPFFVLANSGNIVNRTDVFVISAEEEGDTSTNGHEENNSHPASLRERALSYRERRPPPMR